MVWATGATLVDEWSYLDDRDAKLGWWRWLGCFAGVLGSNLAGPGTFR